MKLIVYCSSACIIQDIPILITSPTTVDRRRYSHHFPSRNLSHHHRSRPLSLQFSDHLVIKVYHLSIGMKPLWAWYCNKFNVLELCGLKYFWCCLMVKSGNPVVFGVVPFLCIIFILTYPVRYINVVIRKHDEQW